MENSILTSTKKILGIGSDYTAFDLDIITHINATLSTINQMGIGPDNCVIVEDDTTQWSDLDVPDNQLSMLRTYVFLKVRMIFDPPASGFAIDATNKQILEFETRLNYIRENTIPIPTVVVDEIDDEIEEGWLYGGELH